MPRILMTGACGGIGTSLRRLLPPIYPDLLLSDRQAARRSRQGRKIQGGRIVRSRRGRGDLRGHRRHPAFRRLFGRRPVGRDPAVQHHRLLQSVRGGAQAGRQARGVCVLEPRGRVLPAAPPDRNRCDGAAGQPLRRQQGVRRGGRRALCRQARACRHLSADRQFRRQAARPPPAVDLAQAGRSGATVPDRARSPRYPFRDFLRRVVQRALVVGQSPRLRSGLSPGPAAPKIFASMRWPSRRSSDRIGSAISTRAARSAAWSSTATWAGSWTGSESASFRDRAQRWPGIVTTTTDCGFAVPAPRNDD